MRMGLNLCYLPGPVPTLLPGQIRPASLSAGAAILTVAVWSLAVPAFLGAQDHAPEARRTVAVMGTLATVEVWAAGETVARSAADAAIRELERTEGVLSSWRTDTEVGLLNAHPVGQARPLSKELGHVLAEVAVWVERTGGSFDPVVGALVDIWDLRGEGRRPTSAEIRVALGATGARGMVYDPSAGTMTRLEADAWLDPGGFGKGAALRNAGDTLRAHGITRARLDLGGQLLIVGETPVSVGVAHPARRSQVAVTLQVTAASIATSGQSERGVDVEGERMGHILDPRTGMPVAAWGSVTVMAADAMVADILATALFVLGPKAGRALARALDGVAVLFLEDTPEGLRPWYNNAMAAHVRELTGTEGRNNATLNRPAGHR